MNIQSSILSKQIALGNFSMDNNGSSVGSFMFSGHPARVVKLSGATKKRLKSQGI